MGVHIKSECLFLKWVGNRNPKKISLNIFFLNSLSYLVFDLYSLYYDVNYYNYICVTGRVQALVCVFVSWGFFCCCYFKIITDSHEVARRVQRGSPPSFP